MPLALSVPIFNKKYHHTKAEELLKFLRPSLNCVSPLRAILRRLDLLHPCLDHLLNWKSLKGDQGKAAPIPIVY